MKRFKSTGQAQNPSYIGPLRRLRTAYLQTAVGARDPPSHLEDRRSLLPTRPPAGRAVPAVERDVGLDLLAVVGPAVTHEEGLARADHDLAQESLVPNFRSGELTNCCLKVRSIPST